MRTFAPMPFGETAPHKLSCSVQSSNDLSSTRPAHHHLIQATNNNNNHEWKWKSMPFILTSNVRSEIHLWNDSQTLIFFRPNVLKCSLSRTIWTEWTAGRIDKNNCRPPHAHTQIRRHQQWEYYSAQNRSDYLYLLMHSHLLDRFSIHFLFLFPIVFIENGLPIFLHISS